MAFATVGYFSRSLEKASTLNVLFPDDPAIPRPWSVLYLLHGLSDDHSIWMRRTSLERHVAGLPLVVVMPDGGRGWYTNALDGDRYEDDLTRDVVGLVDRTFPVRAERAGRCLGGLSMGGLRRGEAGAQAREHVHFGHVALGGGGDHARPGAQGDPRRAVPKNLRRRPDRRTRRPVRAG